MELRSCGHLHFIQAIQGGLITKILNVARGRPTLSFKKVIDIYDNFMFENDKVKVERSCICVMEERTVKTEPDASVCNANDGDDERICVLDDFSFGNMTLKQIQDRCKTGKRKHSQGLDSSKRKVKFEASSSLEDCVENHMESDDSDMETLSSWRSKLSKKMKAKKRRSIKDPVSTVTQEVISVVKADEIQNSQEFPPSSPHSAALVEVKFEVPETDCPDHLKMLGDISNSFPACHRPEDSFGIVATEEPEIVGEFMLENELNYDWKEHADLIPLQIEWASGTDILASNPELSSDQSQNLPVIQFESEECIIQPDLHLISPQAISSAEDDKNDINDNQLDSDSPVTLPNVATNKGLHCVDLGNGGDGAFFSDCCKDKFTSDAEVQAKTSSVSEHIFNPDGCLVCSSDYSPESEEKQLLDSVNVDEATNELISWDGYKSSSKLHRPQRLLSARKAISPSSQAELCKAMQSIDLHDNDHLKCRGKLYFGEQTDEKKGTTEGLNEITRARFVDNCNKINMKPKTLKRGSHSHPLRSVARLSPGHTSMQSCAKSAISFSKRQMHDAECLAMKLTNELKSMKDIMDDMLRSEFCLTTSLRYKVNEARMAVKKATRAEETTKRHLSIMARDCNRFCKLMQLSDDGPPASQDVVRKKRKKIAFADEAGGRLCQVRFYEDEGGSLVETDRKEMPP